MSDSSPSDGSSSSNEEMQSWMREQFHAPGRPKIGDKHVWTDGVAHEITVVLLDGFQLMTKPGRYEYVKIGDWKKP